MLARLGDGRGVEDIVALSNYEPRDLKLDKGRLNRHLVHTFEWSVSLPSPDSQYKCFPRCFLV